MKTALTLFLALAVTAQAQVARVVTNGLILYYPFEGSNGVQVLDASPTSSNGTITGNGLAYGVTKKLGNCISSVSPPNTAYINTPLINNSSSLTAYSFACWVNVGANNSTSLIGSRDGCSGSIDFVFTFFSGKLRLYGDSAAYLESNTVVPVNPAWAHVAFVFVPGGVQSIYLNGKLDGSRSGLAGRVVTAAIQIAKDGGTCGTYFNGSLDDVRLYNRALAAQEIASLVNARRPSQ